MKDQAAYIEAVKILERLREIKANIKTLEEERAKVWSKFHKQRSSIILSCERCGNEVPYGDAGLNRYSPAKTDPEPLEPDVHACYSRFDCKPCGHVNKVRRDPKLDISPW